ncbi:carbamoyltransferase HypF [Beggiatoa leptomitoformis]|uniref:Carbamoyltransferase HypF n=1 Tax=Beggiatoa leptomitoformis TaxID=288004 RepID=A0A2N9YBB4_9GAMM|nr:carbamoyltransferase HypF [Beggiatoa leptomitoformis]ALG66885.1 carbamoyltransferase HypF [Beggiatoa leptomitoformis]AUI67756.1 carbamoyltransferase HypF [Beggiatoa leptomitoformis]
MQADYWLIGGQVQGVGFRPYIYRLATELCLLGWVKNLSGQVEIHVQGTETQLHTFATQLLKHPPPLAKPFILQHTACALVAVNSFSIASSLQTQADIHVPPDYFICDDCLHELHNPCDRHYHYPFINCTQCGARYTLIQRLPYDRADTSMANFPLCADCQAEYDNPSNRRFHAQPLACPACGVGLCFREAQTATTPFIYNARQTATALSACVQALQAGKIVAIKGIGGYHLLCLARSDTAIQRLRTRKARPDKPLAVMFPIHGKDGLTFIRQQLQVSPVAARCLSSPVRPIVLLPRRTDCNLSAFLAPQLNEIGAMLPYSPLHHLLLTALAEPIVATSANLSGEPVLTDNQLVEQRLQTVADAFLHHNREIIRPADDSVMRVIHQQPRPLRIGRGLAPLELTLPFRLPYPVLAVGAQLKNTIALAWEQRVVMSPHIGDLGTARSIDVFNQIINDLQRLYAVSATAVICDAHPQYASSRWAKQSGLPVHSVYHHHAHASAIAGEFPQALPWLVFTWDGVGLGQDGTLWGGDALYGQAGAWQRVARMRPFSLLGGDKVGREPYRSAAGLCWEVGLPFSVATIDSDLLYHAWQKRLNCVTTTSVGRLFDAAAVLIGFSPVVSYEGQAPMFLESLCCSQISHDIPMLPLSRVGDLWESDWSPLLPYLQTTQSSQQIRAEGFHQAMAQALLQQALKIRTEKTVGQIGLTGGVFQNRYLTELVIAQLNAVGFEVFLPTQLPCNDGGMSFGQIIEAGNRLLERV